MRHAGAGGEGEKVPAGASMDPLGIEPLDAGHERRDAFLMTPERPESPEVLDEVRRHREGVRRSIVAVEEALSSPVGSAPEVWWKHLRARLEDLQRAFAHHVEVTEAEGGLFDEVVAAEPRLAGMRRQLEREHILISEALASLVAEGDDGVEPNRIRELALGVLGQLSRHRQRGADFVYEAFCVDVSASD